MKKLILTLTLSAFALATYAGDCEGSSCCSKANATQQTKATPSQSAGKTTAKANKQKNTSAKQNLQSPKAMSLASK
jgi:hypothetical protein